MDLVERHLRRAKKGLDYMALDRHIQNTHRCQSAVPRNEYHHQRSTSQVEILQVPSQIGRSGLIKIHSHRLLRIEPTTGKRKRVSYIKVQERATQRNVLGTRTAAGRTCPERDVTAYTMTFGAT